MPELENHSESLEIALEVTLGETRATVPGGQVKELSLTLHPWGFEGSLGFWVDAETGKDELLARFITQKPGKVSLEVTTGIVTGEETAVPLKLKGVITEKALVRELTVENLELSSDPVLFRYYSVSFADEGQVLWKQHHPCDLLVDAPLKDLLDANACGVSLKTSWDPISKERAVNVLPGFAGEGCASFYDLLIWLANSRNGMLLYDYAKGEYSLTSKKEKGAATVTLARDHLDDYAMHFPETPRYQERMLNSYAEGAETKAITRDNTLKATFRDYPGSFPIPAQFEESATLMTEKTRSRSLEIRMAHSRFLAEVFRPGTLFEFRSGYWSKSTLVAGEVFRVVSVTVQAQGGKAHPLALLGQTKGEFSFSMHSVAEKVAEPFLPLPPFVAPKYPIYLEGLVVSEEGGEKETTYQVYEASDTSAESYKVEIPLLKKQQVVAPLEPLFATGHFYFPAFKGQRVLLALGLHEARIVQFLDYGPGCQLPMESQGNHLFLGKAKEDGTSIKHVYVDGKPQFNIERTAAKDKVSIQIQEGTLVLQTLEEK